MIIYYLILYYFVTFASCWIKEICNAEYYCDRNGVTRHPLYRMKEPVNMTLAAGEHIAVVGRNGAGKVYW